MQNDINILRILKESPLYKSPYFMCFKSVKYLEIAFQSMCAVCESS